MEFITFRKTNENQTEIEMAQHKKAALPGGLSN